MTIRRLEEILELFVSWEEKLSKFYAAVYGRLKNDRSRKVMELLKTEQEKALRVFKEMDLTKYKNTEFIKNPPDWNREEIIPRDGIAADSSPEDIFDLILNCEEKLEKHYTHVRDILAYQNDRELLDVLIQFKLNQIKSIRRYRDDYELAI